MYLAPVMTIRRVCGASNVARNDKGQVTSVQFSVDGNSVLSCGRDDKLRLVDFRTFDVVNTFSAPSFRCGLNWSKAALSADSAFVAAPGHEGQIFVWDARTTV